jgi:hypothetical protein
MPIDASDILSMTSPTPLLPPLLEPPDPDEPVISRTDEPRIATPKAETSTRVASMTGEDGEVVHVGLEVLYLAGVV